MSGLTPTLSKATAKAFLSNDTAYSGEPSGNIKTLNRGDNIYKLVESTLDERIISAAHSHRLEAIEIVNASKDRSQKFKKRLEMKLDTDIRFLFHGTKKSNHSSIFDIGFSLTEEHFGDTDEGYIGKGVYLTPSPEYCASYIKETEGITKYRYSEPVKIGTRFGVLGCIAIVGTTRQKEKKEVGALIPDWLDSHWAWVTSGGSVTGDKSKRFAEEYAIRETEGIYPRFRISLKRITREVIWIDLNITSKENSGYVQRLKQVEGIFVYATANVDDALQALKRKKPGTEYRAITAGRGGEEFVKKVRGEGIHCKILVFCGTVKYHKPWADKLKDVTVTATPAAMISFAKWEN